MLEFEKSGTGIPLVFIHAFPLSRSMWNPVRDHLSKNFQVITVDLPGFGETPVHKDVSSMEEMSRELLETLDSMSLKEKIVLSGVSMGGYVMFQFMKLASDRLRALTFISTRSTPDNEEARDRRKKTIDLVREQGLPVFADKMIPNLLGKSTIDAKLPLVEEIKAQIEKTSPDGICAALRGMAIRPDSTNALQNINIPTLVVCGEEDTFVSPQEMSLLAQRIPRARFETVAKAGHLLTLEQPDAFNEIFSNFLKRSVL